MNEHLGLDLEKEAIEFQEQQNEKNETQEGVAEYPFEGGVIVFGHGWAEKNKSGGSQLSLEAKMRAIGGYQLWKEGLAPKIILTGGAPSQFHKEKFGEDILPNSEQMAKMLIEKFKVPEDAIVLENQSTKTIDNIAHALNALQSQGLPVDNFITMSNGYHMDRISEIMSKFGLRSQPVSAEQSLNDRAREHAEKMKPKDIERGLTIQEVEKNYLMRKGRYDRAIHRIYKTNEAIQDEVQGEGKIYKATKKMPGFWLPLALAVRGDKLKELVITHKSEIEDWMGRHPDMNLTEEDLIDGNFDYNQLVQKGREKPE